MNEEFEQPQQSLRPTGKDRVKSKGMKTATLSPSGVDYNERFLEINDRLEALTEVGRKREKQREREEAKKMHVRSYKEINECKCMLSFFG